MKKLIQLLCVILAFVFVLSSCATGTTGTTTSPSTSPSALEPSNSATVEPSVAPSPELPQYKIGLLAYTTSNAWFERIQKALEPLGKSYNCEFILGDPAGTPDEVLASLENLCTAGVNAVIAQATAGITPRIIEICEKNNVYFTAIDNDITKDPGYDSIATNKFLVGCVSPDDYKSSYDIAKELIGQGLTKFAIFGLPPGVSVSFDNRLNGYIGALNEAGLTPIADARSFNLVEAAQNLFSQNKDVEAVLSSVDTTSYLTQPLISANLVGKVVITSCEDSNDCVKSFSDKTLSYVTEASAARAQVAFSLTYNALAGHKLAQADGKAPLIMLYGLTMRSAEDYQAFLDKSAFSVDDISKLIVVSTPEATLDSAVKLAASLTMESIKAK